MEDSEISNGFLHQNPTNDASNNNPPILKRKRNLPGNPGKLVLSCHIISFHLHLVFFFSFPTFFLFDRNNVLKTGLNIKSVRLLRHGSFV